MKATHSPAMKQNHRKFLHQVRRQNQHLEPERQSRHQFHSYRLNNLVVEVRPLVRKAVEGQRLALVQVVPLPMVVRKVVRTAVRLVVPAAKKLVEQTLNSTGFAVEHLLEFEVELIDKVPRLAPDMQLALYSHPLPAFCFPKVELRGSAVLGKVPLADAVQAHLVEVSAAAGLAF